MYEDLNLTDGTYNAALSIFFVSYALCEPITNALLKRFKPSVFITFSMLLWGVCLTSMGLVTNFAGLATARFFCEFLRAMDTVARSLTLQLPLTMLSSGRYRGGFVSRSELLPLLLVQAI